MNALTWGFWIGGVYGGSSCDTTDEMVIQLPGVLMGGALYFSVLCKIIFHLTFKNQDDQNRKDPFWEFRLLDVVGEL